MEPPLSPRTPNHSWRCRAAPTLLARQRALFGAALVLFAALAALRLASSELEQDARNQYSGGTVTVSVGSPKSDVNDTEQARLTALGEVRSSPSSESSFEFASKASVACDAEAFQATQRASCSPSVTRRLLHKRDLERGQSHE